MTAFRHALTVIALLAHAGGPAWAASPETAGEECPAGCPQGVQLGDAPVRVPLRMAQTAAPVYPDAVGQGRRVLLIFEDLRAAAPTGAPFDVHLGLPAGARPEPDGPHYVGTISFFDAVSPPGNGAEGPSAVLDVTDPFQALRARGLLDDEPSVTLVPSGRLAPRADPSIGGVVLMVE
ncbi:MAG TPA: hypothetical protein VK943_00130 [Arenibaculum sp.]|nr:hypothetical protein [Arenibaculum sp.]